MSSQFLVLGAAAWFLAVNALTIRAYRFDKLCAEHGVERTPEADLLGWVWLGGGPGAWWAMHRFRHKTRKQSFRRRFNAVVATQAGLAALAAVLVWTGLGKALLLWAVSLAAT